MASLPHHADMVGSLLRPERLGAARAEWRAGTLDADELRAIEDDEIASLVRKQEAIGLPAVTDGEFRRDWWHLDFLLGFSGIDSVQRERLKNFSGGDSDGPPIPVVVDRVRHDHPIFVDSFRYLRGVTTTAIPKITIPGPGMSNLMGGPDVISGDAYPDRLQFWDDLVAAYRAEVAELYAAGCRYLQMDDIGFAYLCDADFRAQIAARGEDPDELVVRYRDAMNAVIADRPSDLIVSTHMCRGNFRSRWVASGGYEPIAETIFGGLDVDAFFLEFDSERAGGFEPLRHLAAGKTAVLGLVTSKTAELEDPDDLRARIEQATEFVPLEQLALSPQCGFSSSHHGNNLTEDEQWRKLSLVVDVAAAVWG
ncbi:MAG: 5-methyltetrahydropteroyltriglutamate--homocysteine S-methyltransferase [Acidimicrobiales bacterium]|nr:5-methyltetrahydropteroyltriglutamate--homocysteine S-methyltransferase [Acidimicrobiales bacterium]